jgi:serine/threonine protein kinase/Flp pilus assembly protein TadD
MTASRQDDNELDEILASHLEDMGPAAGPRREELLARYPQWASQLADFFADQDRLAALLRPLNGTAAAGGGITPGPHASAAAAGAHERSQAVVPVCGQRFGDYELLEEIARGGMGVVFKARQHGLQRTVALKMILAGQLATPAEVQRFRLEAEAAAKLDHPNIVPIHDVGAQAGFHFYSMKFIEGSNLASWRLPRPLDRGDQVRVARLLLAVAQAVQHAHERGVLHRDLKPANILVDADGQPHVTDFGLAKHVEAPSPLPLSPAADEQNTSPASERLGRRAAAALPTPSGASIGTPSYMAPEQALGPSNVTTAADIYSLGCIFYELLTGRPPFRAETPLATLLDALERSPRRPAELSPGLDRDLEIICLKCLEKDPHQRYGSARELAEDLNQFVNGDPIRARPVGRFERLQRWCRRQPFQAATLAALLLVVLTAFALVTWQWRRAETNLFDSQRYEKSARREKAEAQKQLQLAEMRLELASSLVEEFCLRLSEDRLSHLPGTLALRKELLEASGKYFQEFLEQKGNDPALRRKLAGTQASLGVLLSGTGSRAQALDRFHAALDIYDDLLRDNPNSPEVQLLRVRTLHRMGVIHSEAGLWDKALDQFEQARNVFQSMAQHNPADVGLQTDLAAVLGNIGNLYRYRGDPAGALPYLKQGLDIRKRVAAGEPDNQRFQSMLASTYLNYGNLVGALGRGRECVESYDQARAIDEKLVKASPHKPEFHRDLAHVLQLIGQQQRLARQTQKARKSLEESRKRLERLVAENPEMVLFQRDLAAAYRELGHLLSTGGKKEDALTWYRRARDTMEKAQRLQPDLPENWNDLAKCWFDMAVVYAGVKGAAADSLQAFEQARVLREKVVAAAPEHPGYRHDLSLTCGNIAVMLSNLGRTEEALAAAEQALRDARRTMAAAPQIGKYRQTCGGQHHRVAKLQWRTGRLDESLANVRARAALWPKNAKELYAAARDLSEFALPAKPNKPSQATTSRTAKAQELVIDLLRQAIDAGFGDRKRIETEEAFASLRARADFQELLSRPK